MAKLGFAVLYRWELDETKVRQFQAAWDTVTVKLREQRGALGSRLHIAEDGTWVAYAQWPSKAAWEASGEAEPVDAAAFEAMRDATVRSFEPILLTPVRDHLMPGSVGESHV